VTGFRNQSRTLDIAAVYTYRAEGMDLTDRPQPERVRTMPVSADYFRVLGVQPILGEVFARADERANANVAVVSERIWREHLGGAADAPGRLLTLNGIPHRIAGVLRRASTIRCSPASTSGRRSICSPARATPGRTTISAPSRG